MWGVILAPWTLVAIFFFFFMVVNDRRWLEVKTSAHVLSGLIEGTREEGEKKGDQGRFQRSKHWPPSR